MGGQSVQTRAGFVPGRLLDRVGLVGGSGYRVSGLQGYLALKKQPTSLGPPWGPMHSPTAGSWVGAVSCERSIPVGSKTARERWFRTSQGALAIFRVWGSGFKVQGSGFRVQNVGFRVKGFGCRV